MPYKSTKIIIEKTDFDRRIKLTDEQKLEIPKLYATGEYSQRQLAAMYNVSRRLITFCIDPEKLKGNVAARKERGGSKIYYNKEKNTEVQREHRRYKQKLLIEGKIKLNKDK